MALDFLKLNPDTFGLDISDYSMKLAKLESKRGGLQLASFGEFPIEEGVIREGEIQDEKKLAESVRAALSAARISTPYVVASLPEEQAFMQVIQLPRMEPEKVREAISFEAENYIPYPLETVYLDHALVPPLRSGIDHLDVLLASLSKGTVDSYLSALDQAGLTPMALEIESLAVSRSLVSGESSEVPVLILDLGATKTGISVFAGKSLRLTTSVSVSAERFTQAIASSMKVSAERAEELKRTYGLFSEEEEGKAVSEALIPAATDLMEQVRKYMDYYASHAKHQHLRERQTNVQEILLCGGGANLKGLPEFLTQALRIKAERGDPWTNILSQDARRIPELPYEESLKYATVLGLALRGVRSIIAETR